MTAPSGLDRHQLAGLDDRQRGFSRPVEFKRTGEQFQALLRYEAVRVITPPHSTQDAALLALIETLHARGYRQMRTQMSFRNGIYLGSQARWIEYPDPPREAEPAGWLTRLAGWIRHPSGATKRP